MTARVGRSKVDYLSKEEREALEKFTRGVKSLLGDNLLILKLFGQKQGETLATSPIRKKRVNVDRESHQKLTNNILKSVVYVCYKLDLTMVRKKLEKDRG